jgi:hypothetical protein
MKTYCWDVDTNIFSNVTCILSLTPKELSRRSITSDSMLYIYNLGLLIVENCYTPEPKLGVDYV